MAASFSIGDSNNSRLVVDVLKYERPLSGDYHDNNWLRVVVRVNVGGFRANVEAAFQSAELLGFLGALRVLRETLREEARFDTLETQLALSLRGDGRGHIDLTGTVSDQQGGGNQLAFSLQIDQTYLSNTIRELEIVTSTFPVRA